ncbi:MAG: Phosphoglycolate phosphatase, bacterial [Candidatus Tokpelaia hoelldobleri]|uniref:Phosphoglycolate phosphatase n=1 Tax=Candidatus Tokpelaia hoelldobleri TaxID=1902579 RepID=A0A1U9JTU3_9HYPH|nr:MAG: Phosphoglycolate phosphatase, bacterial [Candidatus Tokpelaia hoelldoblerii]
MNKQPIVVFDLDGTLVETGYDMLASLNHALAAKGFKTMQTADLHRLVGQGGRVTIERALKLQNLTPTAAEIEPLFDLYIRHYAENIPGTSRYFDHVEPALDTLQQAGFLLAVCTNKQEELAKPLLKAIDRAGRYAAICGCDTFPWRKPDPRHILETIATAGGDATRAVMVGDSAADIHAAKAANIPVIAVDFGYTDIPVRELDPTAIISSYSELTPQMIEGLLA